MRRFRFDYAVAISFAGEDRKHAEGLAHELTKLGISVFYDDYERSLLWGKDLPTLLASVYRDRARYCVMFVSKHYVSKAYPVHERQHAIERQLRERGEDYILPVRIDDTELPDLPGTICYEDMRKTSAVELAHLLKEKLEDDGQHKVLGCIMMDPQKANAESRGHERCEYRNGQLRIPSARRVVIVFPP